MKVDFQILVEPEGVASDPSRAGRQEDEGAEPHTAAGALRSSSNAVRKPCTPLRSTKSTTMRFDVSDEPRPAHYAIDDEMVTVIGPGDMPERRAMVSVGIVNDRLETVLYGRVAVPAGSKVTDGAFARVEGGLWASWDEGIPVSCVSDLLARHAMAGGLIVGWEIHGDLDVVGFEEAAELVRSGRREGLPLRTVHINGGGASRATGPPASPPRCQQATCVAPSEEVGSCASSQDLPKLDDPGCSRVDPGRRGTWRMRRPRGQDVDGGMVTTERDDRTLLANDGVLRRREQESGDVETTGIEQREHPAAEDSGNDDETGTSLCYDEQRNSAATPAISVVEVTDLFRTMNGLKCTLTEACECCFDRVDQGAHNAAVDARMTMELFNLWRRAGAPEQPIGLPLSFFVLNFHSFKSGKERQATMWNLLRPEGKGGRGGRRQTAIEKDSGKNTYKLLFRNERERAAYLAVVDDRMAAQGVAWAPRREVVPGRKGARDGYQVTCKLFKMHVFELER